MNLRFCNKLLSFFSKRDFFASNRFLKEKKNYFEMIFLNKEFTQIVFVLKLEKANGIENFRIWFSVSGTRIPVKKCCLILCLSNKSMIYH